MPSLGWVYWVGSDGPLSQITPCCLLLGVSCYSTENPSEIRGAETIWESKYFLISEQQAFVCCQWKEVGETCSNSNAAQALLLEKRFSAHIPLAGPRRGDIHEEGLLEVGGKGMAFVLLQ